MKILSILSFLMVVAFANAQINYTINFNSASLPTDWTFQGNFEIQNAEIYPKCQENAFVGTFFEPDQNFWVKTGNFNSNGEDISIWLTYGIKDLYHSLGINSSFHKPQVFLEYTASNDENWTQYSEISLQDVGQSANCLTYNVTIPSANISGLESLKFRFVYKSPQQQPGSIYLLYWSLDSLQIVQETSASCTQNLGGGTEPSFVSLKINGTAFDHTTYAEPTEYYHSYPQANNTTATLTTGQTYNFYTFTSSEAVIGFWLDYNHNSLFEANEWVELVNNMNSQNTTPITIPNSAMLGTTKMRIRSRAYGSSINANDACTNFGSGETRDYLVTITNDNLSVADLTKNSISIYPNPVSNLLHIVTDTPVDIEIVSLDGRKQLSKRNTNVINLETLSSGIYLAKIETDKGLPQKIIKIVKQ